MKEPDVSVELAKELGLTLEEFSRIKEILGRLPTYTELGIYSVMWSEHCSYKNSIALLKTLPRTGDRLLAEAGEENAGLIDMGDGLAVAFKIESHNHPSAVEPYQGAATGVGGILRDIFSLGARPVALLNSLRFGNPEDSRVRYLLRGVVKGISDYGNSFGVPTIAGDVFFDDCYKDNPIVNAMAVGIVEKNKITRAVARGVNNPVMIVGSSTGRDGIHGATFASEALSSESESRRPSVQVGDPFTEKSLLEAILESIESGCIVGIQDMGAAGITCSTSEMSARGNVGMVLNLDKVPVREAGMTPYEIMLSESQERMLLVVKRGCENTIRNIFAKWDLNVEVIGYVTEGEKIVVNYQGRKVADIPAHSLVLGGGAPTYQRESREPEYLRKIRNLDVDSLKKPGDLDECIRTVLRSNNLLSKRWIYEQYDSMVQTNTISQLLDAGVIRIKGTNKYLSLKTDCNPRYTYLNPRRGAMIAVAESARNVVCTGAQPIAITNCLNFGNPYKPETFWYFKESVLGIGEACRALGTPVTGGNVSFYNESPEGSILPTPIIGMLGLGEGLEFVTDGVFQDEGDVIILLGHTKGQVGGSEYLRVWHGLVAGDAPELDLQLEKRIQTCCLDMIFKNFIKSAHDVSDGGLISALVESCISNSKVMGATIRLKFGEIREDFFLFGEDQSRIMITCDASDTYKVLKTAESYAVPVEIIGEVTTRKYIDINGIASVDLEAVSEEYHNRLGRIIEQV